MNQKHKAFLSLTTEPSAEDPVFVQYQRKQGEGMVFKLAPGELASCSAIGVSLRCHHAPG